MTVAREFGTVGIDIGNGPDEPSRQRVGIFDVLRYFTAVDIVVSAEILRVGTEIGPIEHDRGVDGVVQFVAVAVVGVFHFGRDRPVDQIGNVETPLPVCVGGGRADFLSVTENVDRGAGVGQPDQSRCPITGQ